MKRTSILGLGVLLLTACTGNKQSSDSTIEFGKLALPVSETKLCLDWYTVFSDISGEDDFFDEDGNPVNMPLQYLVTDLDKDGQAEVLMQGERSTDAAILSYDKDGKLKFSDATNDGYLCLGVGNGWYVREFDDHMGEYRTFTHYYYKVENGQFDFIGEKSTGFDGLDENGEYKETTSDGTEGKAPSDDAIQMFYSLEGWINIHDDAKSDALTALADGNSCDNDDDCECDEPDNQYFAGEVTLDDGTRLRLDYVEDANNRISGTTTYYRSNGKSSKIPFFGTKYYDRFVNQDFVHVAEHYNGKCCGHMLWSLNDDNQLNSGFWYLRDKKLYFETFEVKQPIEGTEYAQPAISAELADRLLPCSRPTLKQLYANVYPNAGPAQDFMLVDMNSDGTFEVFVKEGSISSPKIALVWVENGQPQVMSFGENHTILLHQSAMFVGSADGQSLYRWNNVKPVRDSEAGEEDLQFFDNFAQDMTAMGEWLSIE